MALCGLEAKSAGRDGIKLLGLLGGTLVRACLKLLILEETRNKLSLTIAGSAKFVSTRIAFEF